MWKHVKHIRRFFAMCLWAFVSSAFSQSQQCTVEQINDFNARCNQEAEFRAGLEAGCLAWDPTHYACGFYPLPAEARKTSTGMSCMVTWVRSPAGTESSIPTWTESQFDLDCTVPPDVPIDAKNAGDSCSPQSDCGNPINVGVGNKHQREVDYVGGGRFPLRIVRTYNSNSASASGLAPGWRLSYRLEIVYTPPDDDSTEDSVVLLRGDGKQFFFSRKGGAGAPWVSDADVTGTLVSQGSSATPAGWTFTNAQDEVESYDADGKLLSIANRDGATQTLTYSCKAGNPGCVSETPASVAPMAGLLIGVTDSSGRQLSFTYDKLARISTITDPLGGVYTYTYGGASNKANLTGVTYPDGAVRTYLYDESGNVSSSPATGVNYGHALTGIQDENGVRYVTWRYDAHGRAYSSEHGSDGADRVAMTYNADGTATVVDALGTSRTYHFATSSGTTRNVGITGQPCDGCFKALAYDANGNVTSQTDFNGHVTCLSYDLTRNLETARVEGLPAGTACPSSLDGFTVPAGARKVTTQWHGTWRMPMRIAEPRRITTFVYNGDGGQSCAPTAALVGRGAPIGVLCGKTEQPTTDADGSQGAGATASGMARTTRWAYDSDGRMLSVKGPRTDLDDQISVSYRTADDTAAPPQYRHGDLYRITDALNHTTTIDRYDANGRPLQMTDANGIVTTFTYAPRGWLTSQTITPADGAGLTTSYSYDAAGQLTKVTQPNGSAISFSHDSAHRLTGISDNRGNSIAYTLDAMGNRLQEQVKGPSGALARQVTRIMDNLNRLQQLTVGVAPVSSGN
ncbi:DUF6531 domain-containing protein [Ralstonia solanacearum]|nr:DUF6531 domain-containing protein [Ralstonia solanacearum]